VLLTQKHLISNNETSQSLTESLSSIGAELILETLDRLNELHAIPQNNDDATYAKKISKVEAQIDWSQSAENISLMIRAFNPRPIAKTNAKAKQFEKKVIRIIEAEAVQYESSKTPGTIVELGKGICYVATGNGILNLIKVQLTGKNKVSIKDFNNAYQLIKLN
jgi:methionyl-tRNA formyltransferase